MFHSKKSQHLGAFGLSCNIFKLETCHQNSRKRSLNDTDTEEEEMIFNEPKNEKRKVCDTKSLSKSMDVDIT